MRVVMYEVSNKDNVFTTVSYNIAHTPGNKILKTFLTDVPKTEKELAAAAKGRARWYRHLAHKKARLGII